MGKVPIGNAMLPVNSSRIHEVLKRARQFEAANDPLSARKTYQQALAIDGKSALAHFHLGQLEFKSGHSDPALKHLARAAKLAPKEPAVWQLYAQAAGASGSKQAVTRVLREAKAARLDRSLLMSLQTALGRSGDSINKIKEMLRQAERQSHAGKHKDAVAQIQKALALNPKYVPAIVALGQALYRANAWSGAIRALEMAVAEAPQDMGAWYELGRAQLADGRYAAAVESFNKSKVLGAPEPARAILTSEALSALGRDQDALNVIDTASQNHADVLTARATILQSLGEFDKARDSFRRAVQLAPDEGRIFRSLTTTEKLTADDPLIPQMIAGFENPRLRPEQRWNFGFALAKAMEDSAQFDQVFRYLRPANQMVRRAHPYEITVDEQQVDAIIAMFDQADFDQFHSDEQDAPIFVTGMPRSGTTLVEQILASHSTVTGGGELGYAGRIFQDALLRGDGGFAASQLRDERLTALGGQVRDKMRAQFPDLNQRVTDKGVQSYLMLGPIRAALPRARFVIVERDPRDMLLSIYKNLFASGRHLYAYDLRDLVKYWRLRQKILGFWRRKTPDWVSVIRYEDLVADPETQTRRLLAACDLDWQGQCLEFHKTKRRVGTLSVHQVRQPLYASSVAAWRRYEDELADLLDELGPNYEYGDA